MALRLRPIIFYTASPGSVHNAKPDGSPWGDVTYKMFDAAGLETAVEALAVRTQVDIEPTLDFYALHGGWVDTPPAIIGGVTDLWYLSATGVPDVPEAQGGSIPFMSEINLEAISVARLEVKSDRPINLHYHAAYHTSKLRFTVKHPQGLAMRFQIALETFR